MVSHNNLAYFVMSDPYSIIKPEIRQSPSIDKRQETLEQGFFDGLIGKKGKLILNAQERMNYCNRKTTNSRLTNPALSVQAALTQSLFSQGSPRFRTVAAPHTCCGWRSVSFSQAGQVYTA